MASNPTCRRAGRLVVISRFQSSSSSSVDCRLNTGPGAFPLSGVTRRSRTCGSGEVEGVVDFREEDAVLVRSLEDEAAEGDNSPDCFADENGEVTEGGLGFRDVAVETEESGRREATLVSVALVETVRLVGSAICRDLGRRGDFEVAFARGLITFLTSFGGSASASTGMGVSGSLCSG